MSVLLPSINSMYRNSFFPLHFRWVLRIKHRECVVVHVILFWRSFYIVKYEMVVLVVLECFYDGSMIMHAQPFFELSKFSYYLMLFPSFQPCTITATRVCMCMTLCSLPTNKTIEHVVFFGGAFILPV